MANQRTPPAVRSELEDLTAEIQSLTPVKVMANPNTVRDTALRTCNLMADMLVLIEQLPQYQPKEIGLG